ncbi:hypothetical protein Micbo1qcDRAFT_209446 [Microdochium bolleyi]|uniref:Uncharacterized protein n=1 Tax=Microdochium bolleyi TaxID=196109 RepID=A0A136IM79_9PEZI|nr:hypothetical protein Micbo1qcDRAFT_209446 [Microdochium bolleyi]
MAQVPGELFETRPSARCQECGREVPARDTAGAHGSLWPMHCRYCIDRFSSSAKMQRESTLCSGPHHGVHFTPILPRAWFDPPAPLAASRFCRICVVLDSQNEERPWEQPSDIPMFCYTRRTGWGGHVGVQRPISAAAAETMPSRSGATQVVTYEPSVFSVNPRMRRFEEWWFAVASGTQLQEQQDNSAVAVRHHTMATRNSNTCRILAEDVPSQCARCREWKEVGAHFGFRKRGASAAAAAEVNSVCLRCRGVVALYECVLSPSGGKYYRRRLMSIHSGLIVEEDHGL